MIKNKIILDDVPFKSAVEKGTISHSPNDYSDSGITSISQPTELGESLKELNLDRIDTDIRMSSIDMRARLYPIEISYILAMDSLISLRVLPVGCGALTRGKKRLSVSLNGLGRKEIVDIVGGKRDLERDTGIGGFGNKVKSFFGGTPKE